MAILIKVDVILGITGQLYLQFIPKYLNYRRLTYLFPVRYLNKCQVFRRGNGNQLLSSETLSFVRTYTVMYYNNLQIVIHVYWDLRVDFDALRIHRFAFFSYREDEDVIITDVLQVSTSITHNFGKTLECGVSCLHLIESLYTAVLILRFLVL